MALGIYGRVVMNFKGFIGPSYQLNSVNVDSQRCINLYPEIIESGSGKGNQVAYLKGTPGLKKILEVGGGPIRCIHRDFLGRIFVVSGNQIFQIRKGSGIWSGEELEDSEDNYLILNSSHGLVSARSMSFAGQGEDSSTVFVDGSNNYLYWDEKNKDYIGILSDFGYEDLKTASHISWIDGYFIVNKSGTNQFYLSGLKSFNIGVLNFTSSEGSPDIILGHIENGRDLWVFNEFSTEVFVNTGNPDFPFERVQGGFMEIGCLARYSIARIQGTVFWLGRSQHGQGVVYAARGLQPQRISTHAVEQAIGKYKNPSEATAFTYEFQGHVFYVLNFKEGTWVYDLSTGLWHERAFTKEGSLERHRAETHAFIPELGVHLVGDYATNALYELDENTYTDDGEAISRIRICPHLSSEQKRLFCHSFQLDMEVGVGSDGKGFEVKKEAPAPRLTPYTLSGSVVGQGRTGPSAQKGLGVDPQAVLEFSSDGGHTWSHELWAGVGRLGEYKKRLLWRRLGSFRDRVFKVTITDPIPVRLISAELQLSQGRS